MGHFAGAQEGRGSLTGSYWEWLDGFVALGWHGERCKVGSNSRRTLGMICKRSGKVRRESTIRVYILSRNQGVTGYAKIVVVLD